MHCNNGEGAAKRHIIWMRLAVFDVSEYTVVYIIYNIYIQ